MAGPLVVEYTRGYVSAQVPCDTSAIMSRDGQNPSICSQLNNQILLVANIDWIYMYMYIYISITLLSNNQTNRRKYYSGYSYFCLFSFCSQSTYRSPSHCFSYHCCNIYCNSFIKIQSQINLKHQCFGKPKKQQFSSFFSNTYTFFPIISWLKILVFPPPLVFFIMILPLLNLLPFTGNNISFYPLFKHPTLQMSRIQKKAHLLTESKHAWVIMTSSKCSSSFHFSPHPCCHIHITIAFDVNVSGFLVLVTTII